jgi:predicted nuclease of predicted toxin-antitoxin system
MNFLVDNQLPAALARWLNSQGHTSLHVLDIRMDEADDIVIWKRATEENWILISKDDDFFHMANQPDATTQVVWVRLGNCRKQTLLAAFDKLMPQIIKALQMGERIVEVR